MRAGSAGAAERARGGGELSLHAGMTEAELQARIEHLDHRIRTKTYQIWAINTAITLLISVMLLVFLVVTGVLS